MLNSEYCWCICTLCASKFENGGSNDLSAGAASTSVAADANQLLRNQQQERKKESKGKGRFRETFLLLVVKARTIIITDSGLCARLRLKLF